METSQQILSRQIHETFVTTLMKVQSQNMLLSDMYVQLVEGDAPQLVIYDDSDNILTQVVLDAWHEWKSDLAGDDIETSFVSMLDATVNADALLSIFNEMEYNGPFSLLLVDDQMNVISELLTIDKENILLGDEFWEKMDKELDEFYEKLMSDIHFK